MKNTSPTNIATQTELYKQWREKILASDPDIDEETLADTLEGVSDITDIIIFLSRQYREKMARAEGLKQYKQQINDKQQNVLFSAKKINVLIASIMRQANIEKIPVTQRPEGPIYFKAPKAVIEIDVDALPDAYKQVVTHETIEPSMAVIEEEIANENEIEGVTVTSKETLVIKG